MYLVKALVHLHLFIINSFHFGVKKKLHINKKITNLSQIKQIR